MGLYREAHVRWLQRTVVIGFICVAVILDVAATARAGSVIVPAKGQNTHNQANTHTQTQTNTAPHAGDNVGDDARIRAGDVIRVGDARQTGPGKLKPGYEVWVAVGEWPPMISETLPDFGKHAKRFQTIFNAMGFEVRFIFVPWQRAYEQTRQGIYVATFPWLRTVERRDAFHIPRYPIAQAHQKGFYKKSRFPEGIDINALRDVVGLGLRPVGIASYWYEQEFRRLGIEADIVNNPESAWRFLHADRADILFEEEAVGWHDLTGLLGEQVAARYATTNTITTNDMFILFSRKHPFGAELMQAYETFMMSDDGQEICKEWALCKSDFVTAPGTTDGGDQSQSGQLN
ncbi:hypothetical protein [Thalassospira povalilytica]|uniref:hypothetical protein n=1 Tax=Thalassospira povalilytica TaxID=732237 RepID=UPI003AA7D8DE